MKECTKTCICHITYFHLDGSLEMRHIWSIVVDYFNLLQLQFEIFTSTFNKVWKSSIRRTMPILKKNALEKCDKILEWYW